MAGRGARGRTGRRGSGELESEVLAVLWAAERPLTPSEIQSEIDGGLAYNTVHTILKRLCDKGLVLREADGRRGAYRPAKSAAELTAQAMHDALERGPDPVAALRQFVTGLSPEQERALRDLLTDGAVRRPPSAPRGRSGCWACGAGAVPGRADVQEAGPDGPRGRPAGP